jgi:transcription initiation factor TFIIB
MFAPNGGANGAGGFQEDLSNTLLCPDCKINPPNLAEEFSSGDMVCRDCGVVVGTRIIDTRSEWRTFANDDQAGDDPSRVGGPQDEFQDSEQLSTSVAFSETKAHKALARTQNNANLDKGGKSLQEAYRLIASYSDVLSGGQNVTNAAKHVYRLVDKHNFMKGKGRQDVIVSACLFIAFRENKIGRTFKEIHNVTHVTKKDLGKVYKQLLKFLETLQQDETLSGATSLNTVSKIERSSVSAADLCGRYVSQIGFKQQQKIARMSREVAELAPSTLTLAGRSPLSVAAASIYMVCHLAGEPTASGPIAKIAGVSDGTVKAAYKIMFASRHKLIKQEWLDEGMRMEDIPQLSA